MLKMIYMQNNNVQINMLCNSELPLRTSQNLPYSQQKSSKLKIKN